MTSNFLGEMKSDAIYPLLYFLGVGLLYVTPVIVGASCGPRRRLG
jgi:hypothetical protein